MFLWAQIKQKAKQRKTKTQNAKRKNAKRQTQKRIFLSGPFSLQSNKTQRKTQKKTCKAKRTRTLLN